MQDKNGGFFGALGERTRSFAVAQGDTTRAFDLNGLGRRGTRCKDDAGLRDAYRHTGNKTALAWRQVRRMGRGCRLLTDAQFENPTPSTADGEILADLYADTGDKRWLPRIG